MTGYLLDTNHVSALLRGNTRLSDRIQVAEDAEFGVCIPTIAELWYMVFNSRRVEQNTQELTRLIGKLRTWSFDLPAAMEFGRIQTQLRQQGRPIPSIDVQIAAVGRVNELVVLTSDQHFSAVENLQIEDWVSHHTA